jgi:hypothetical protein
LAWNAKNIPQPIVAQAVATRSHIINAGAVLLAKRNFSRKLPEGGSVFNLCMLLQVLSSLMDRSAGVINSGARNKMPGRSSCFLRDLSCRAGQAFPQAGCRRSLPPHYG